MNRNFRKCYGAIFLLFVSADIFKSLQFRLAFLCVQSNTILTKAVLLSLHVQTYYTIYIHKKAKCTICEYGCHMRVRFTCLREKMRKKLGHASIWLFSWSCEWSKSFVTIITEQKFKSMRSADIKKPHKVLVILIIYFMHIPELVVGGYPYQTRTACCVQPLGRPTVANKLQREKLIEYVEYSDV